MRYEEINLLMPLFSWNRLSVFDDWMTPMYQARVRIHKERTPERPDTLYLFQEISRWLDIFFISFVLFSSLLMVNVFISVVMNQYIMYQAERDDKNLNAKTLRRYERDTEGKTN